MVFGRTAFGFGRLGICLTFAVLSALTACAGKSARHGEDGDGDNGDAGDDGNGGSSASGGTSGGGKGGTTGKGGTSGTSNIGVITVSQQPVSKADLLFMVDNSISMGDKQRLLADAIPVLVSRLVDPPCVDSNGNVTDPAQSDGCSEGVPEFPPIRDLHIGVITSSLGNHGGDVCVPDPNDTVGRTLNDRAQLLATMRTGLYSYSNMGFLVWDPRPAADRGAPDPHPAASEHESNVNQLIDDLTTHVTAPGERGCGYEASLEAWYRFLIDPEPVGEVTADTMTGFSVRGPVNQLVLDQRRAFLRPDSLLAIVMLTDENDCSIVDENNMQGWLVGRRIAMPRASSECSHPEDPDAYQCCRPCVIDLPGCPPSASDVECAKGANLSMVEDSTNLRCYQQRRRFGIDLLYPWRRYQQGLLAPRVALRDGTEIPNPIYTPGTDGTPARDSSLVYLVGIVGVPWQDIATDDSLAGPGLTYLTASELAAVSRGPNGWDMILGDPDSGVPPRDPFMIESVDARSGTNPNTGDAIMPPTSGNQGNAINGHESLYPNRDDLQYACRFDLVPDVECTQSNQDGCDCNASERDYQRSLCVYSTNGEDGTQTHGKAYPGVRQLQVLQGFGNNSIVASICPKNVMGSAADDPNYGYNPAILAMVRRFKEALGPRCLARPLTPDSSGRIPCRLVEARLPDGGGCSCATSGRSDLSSSTITGAIQDELMASSLCGGATGVSCDDYCLCEIEQFSGDELVTCQTATADPMMISLSGFCYIDARVGGPDFVASCPATQPQTIRFMGPDLPAPRSVALLACTGQ